MEMPYSKFYEENCLGGYMICTIYLNPEYAAHLPDMEDFYLEQHKQVWKVMLDLNKRGIEPWENPVKDELQRIGKLEWAGGRDFIHHLVYCALSQPGERGWDPSYATLIIHSYRLRRELLARAIAMAEQALDFSKGFQVTHD